MSELEDPPVLNEVDQALNKAADMYRKLMERDDVTDEQREKMEGNLQAMMEREVIENSEAHQPKEIISDEVQVGPPTLTRFEKARIMGARALQLSMGAPPFVDIPVEAKMSLTIANEELDMRVIPIVIRRTLPNGDFQNIPIRLFD